MKGLFYKDARLLWARCKTNLLVELLLLSASVIVVSRENSMVLFCLMYAGYFLSTPMIQLFTCDRTTGWNDFSGTLPVTAAQIVTARYQLTLVLNGVAALWLLGMAALVGLLGGGLPPIKVFALLAVILCLSLSCSSVLFPLWYHFGQAGSMLYPIVAGVLAGLCAIAVSKATISGPVNGSYLTALTRQGAPFFVGAVAACMALFAVSWRLSIRFYRSDAE